MELKNVYTAFVKAQRGFAPALKTNTNPHFKSKYADLAACVEAVLDSLNANGIGLMQRTHEDATGVTVETVFVHESGELMSGGILHVPAAKQDPQGYGSALSYARRYSLMAACGIAPEDDDGNAASKPFQRPNAQPEQRQRTGVVADVLNQTTPPDPQRAEELHELAAMLADDVAAYGGQAAHERTEEAGLSNDEKIYVWSKLDAKTRSAIKAYSQSITKKAA